MERKLPKHPLTFTAKAGKGPAPLGVDKKRWKKEGENLRRAERLTGVAVIAPEGWETVAVILMDMLEAKE